MVGLEFCCQIKDISLPFGQFFCDGIFFILDLTQYDGYIVCMDTYDVVMMGGAGTGKSAFVLQFVAFGFADDYNPLLNDAHRKVVVVDDEVCTLNVWDLTSKEVESVSMTHSAIRNGVGFALLYSITDRMSLQEALESYFLARKIKDKENLPAVLIGNKIDLEELREVSAEEAQQTANKWNIPHIESSAKQSINVLEPFYQLVQMIRNPGAQETHARTMHPQSFVF